MAIGMIKKSMIILLAFLLGLTQMVSFAENVYDNRSPMIENPNVNNVKLGFAPVDAPAPAAPVDPPPLDDLSPFWICPALCQRYCDQINRSTKGCEKACGRCCLVLGCVPGFPLDVCDGWDKLKPVVHGGRITTCPLRKSS